MYKYEKITYDVGCCNSSNNNRNRNNNKSEIKKRVTEARVGSLDEGELSVEPEAVIGRSLVADADLPDDDVAALGFGRSWLQLDCGLQRLSILTASPSIFIPCHRQKRQ